MTSPRNAVTLDDERYYTLAATPGVHYPSITTIIKQGVPKPQVLPWATKTAAIVAYEDLDLLVALKERAHGDR